MLGGIEIINRLAKAGAEAGTFCRIHLEATPSQRPISLLRRRGMETQNILMTHEFDVFT